MLCNKKFINASLKSYKNMKCVVGIVHFYFYFKVLLRGYIWYCVIEFVVDLISFQFYLINSYTYFTRQNRIQIKFHVLGLIKFYISL